MKKLGLMVLVFALCTVLSGCWNGSPMDNSAVQPTFGAAPEATNDPFMGDTAATPLTGEAGEISSTGVDPSATDAPLSDNGIAGM
ncbi:MAG: hypothetical protein E7335_07645 [Clostridiales bacterium]|nr:hypothetical protein [Clostridiales bacterium]